MEPHLNLVKDWLDDGHTVDEARALFESRGLRVVASSQLEVMCFGSPDARMPNLKANAENSRLFRELGADKMIVGTDGPEQNSVDAVVDATRNLAEATEDVGVDIAIEFNWSPPVKSLQSAVRVAEIANHPRGRALRYCPLPRLTDEARRHKRGLREVDQARPPKRHAR